jgi:hydrogenase expression/formation protein HypD
VSAIIGSSPYQFIADEFGVPGVIAGFEPLDILMSIDMLLAQIADNQARIDIQYNRTVHPQGNVTAQRYISEVFEPSDANWRGLGSLPGSGLRLRAAYSDFDAVARFPVQFPPAREHPGCACGAVLRGAIEPPSCPLYGKVCTPERPVGPCMVSNEGTCAAWYQYAGFETGENGAT